MRLCWLLSLLGVILGLWLPTPAAAAQQGDTKVGVLAFQASGVSEEMTEIFDEMLLAAIHRFGRYEVIGSDDVIGMLGPLARKLLPCTGLDCASRIGRATDTVYLVSGKISALGSKFVISLSLTETVTPRVVNRVKAFASKDENAYADALDLAVGDLFKLDQAAIDATAAAVEAKRNAKREQEEAKTAVEKAEAAEADARRADAELEKLKAQEAKATREREVKLSAQRAEAAKKAEHAAATDGKTTVAVATARPTEVASQVGSEGGGRIWHWMALAAGVGAGIAGGAVGASFGLDAQAAMGERVTTTDPAAWAAAGERASANALSANVAFGVGGGVAAVGITVFLIGLLSGDDEPRVSAGIDPSTRSVFVGAAW